MDSIGIEMTRNDGVRERFPLGSQVRATDLGLSGSVSAYQSGLVLVSFAYNDERLIDPDLLTLVPGTDAPTVTEPPKTNPKLPSIKRS